MAENHRFPDYLSQRARFPRAATLPDSPCLDFDLTLSQLDLARVAELQSKWGVGPRVLPYDPNPRGSTAARTVLASFLSRRAPTTLDDLLLTASTSEAYAYLLLALCDPGDAILVPTPGYPLLDDIAQLMGVRLIQYALRYDGDWYLDAASLPSGEEREQQRLRFVVAVSPHNPTGHVLAKDEFAALAQLGLPIVIDEVFQAHVLEPRATDVDPLVSGAQTSLTLVLNGLSKLAAAPGLKLGWICARGEQGRTFLRELEYVSDAFLSVHQLVQTSLAGILEQVGEIGEEIRARVLKNQALVRRTFQDSAVTALLPRAGWSSILRLPSLCDEATWLSSFAQAGVRVQPGSLYDLPFKSSVVVSLLTDPTTLGLGLAKLQELVTQSAAAPAQPGGGAVRRV